MPDIKISDLTVASSASGAQQIEINDGGVSKKITVDQIKAYVVPADSITADKIAADAVGSSEIAAGAVGTSELADAGVTSSKLAGGAALANLGFTPAADSDVAKLAGAQTLTGSKRGTVTVDNDGSFDMAVTNNFKCTPAAAITLTFTNIAAGQSGYVLLVNTGGYAVSSAATTKVNSSFLAAVSTAGTYLISYFSDGTNVYATTGGAMV